MQLKCPGCSSTLKIPDSAAGKIVKCPCGKQIRVPGGQPQAASPRPAAGRSTATASRPAAAPASGPASSEGGFGGFDAGMFDELTESDMRPVNVPKAANAPPAPTNAALNPYASPASGGTANATKPSHSGQANAPQNKRLGNYILDAIFFQIGAFFMGVVVGLVMAVGGGEAPSASQQMTVTMVTYGVSFLMFLLYYAGTEFLFGATPGKFLTGTRVVAEDGGKAGLGKIIGRTFARIIPFDPLSFCFGDKTTGWHDSLSGTRVIEINA